MPEPIEPAEAAGVPGVEPDAEEVEPEVEGFAIDGISSLLQVSQMQSANANGDAMARAGAEMKKAQQVIGVRQRRSHLRPL